MFSIDYGENWLDEREGRYTDFVPRSYDYERAGETFEKLLTKIDISTINSGKFCYTVFQNLINSSLLIHAQYKKMCFKTYDYTSKTKNST
jgi:hypothetical protein